MVVTRTDTKTDTTTPANAGMTGRTATHRSAPRQLPLRRARRYLPSVDMTLPLACGSKNPDPAVLIQYTDSCPEKIGAVICYSASSVLPSGGARTTLCPRARCRR